ncbi:hypothetical protein G9A89_010179 [Geosiphon pyriformis]|nr:hypothetical protein G9A89_010179 [Geosiphon pyriformis]
MNANRSFFFPSSTTLPTTITNSNPANSYLLSPSLVANAAKKNTNSAERRANHNAVERARRECLNTKFQELAHALPSLAQVRRPSKSIIVQKSLEFICLAQQKDKLHEKDLYELKSENNALRGEINRLREQLGMEPLPPREESTQQNDDDDDGAKEDATSNCNQSETQCEADNKISNNHNHNNNVQGSALSEVQIKCEESRSEDDDHSNGISDEEYDLESTDIISDPAGMTYTTMLEQMNQHPGFPTTFDFTSLDMQASLDPMVDALPLNFDSSVPDDMGNLYSDPYALTQKFYPSPPYQAAILDYGHIPYSMSPESSHI